MTETDTAKPKHTRAWFWTLGAAIVVIAAGLLYWQNFTTRALIVRVETVAPGHASRVLAVNGQVAAASSVSVRSAVTGSILGKMAEVGQSVAAGDVLAQVDPTQQQAVVRQAQSALAQGMTVQAQARSDYARLRDLGSIATRASVEAAQTTLAGASQSVESLTAMLEQAQIQLSRYTIVAPIAGVIMQRNADPGQFIDPSLSLFTLSDLSTLVVETNVDEAYATQVAKGQIAALQLVGTTQTLPGKVSFVSPRVDPTTGGLEVKIAPDAILSAPVGLTVTANIVIEDRADALTVPRTAMLPGPAVFVVKSGRATRTPIAAIDWPAARLIVTQGLDVGDVVISDATGVKDGALVKGGS